MPKLDLDLWEPWFKACSALAAVVSTLGLLAGGGFGLYTYYQQVKATEELKAREMGLLLFNQKKDVYYELVDVAAAVGASTSKEEAARNAARFETLYFGRAHIFAVDKSVHDGKVAFRDELQLALNSGEFPNRRLQNAALALSKACKEVLKVQDVYTQNSQKN